MEECRELILEPAPSSDFIEKAAYMSDDQTPGVILEGWLPACKSLQPSFNMGAPLEIFEGIDLGMMELKILNE